ncbi:hypothetical protein Amal_03728 [Acetobacter malorum]|uniref:Uncharacterized protein n=1 Tax=Acetobacter malorum TaxID=178901 RepID=A0A177G5K3_9PROT|nr:hypothetical protein Amal_03728 [Acetobacter malorum]
MSNIRTQSGLMPPSQSPRTQAKIVFFAITLRKSIVSQHPGLRQTIMPDIHAEAVCRRDFYSLPRIGSLRLRHQILRLGKIRHRVFPVR